MHLLSWRKRRADQQLSAYLDGELSPQQTAAVGERLVFDRGCRDRLASFQRLAEVVDAALSPPRLPDPTALTARLANQAARSPREHPRLARPGRTWVRPAAVLASVGLLVTAGLALAQLRRRGLI